MFRRRLALLALVATVAFAAAPPGRADTVTAPFLRPAMLTPGVPHEVGIAVDGLRQACATWHLSVMSLPLLDADDAPQPGSPVAAFLAVRRLCDTAIHPDQTEWSLFFTNFPTFVAVVLACLFAGTLISAWTRRFPFGAKSSW